MNKEFSAPTPAAIVSSPAARPAAWIRSIGIVFGGSILLAICSHIALPLFFSPVPLTLQTFAVLLIGLSLSPRLAAATVVTYLAEGALGLPVFAPSPLTGIAHLLGPTGGYLLTYPIAAALTAMLWRRFRHGVSTAAFAASVGSIIILAAGAAWLALLTHAGVQIVMNTAVLPFIPGDLLKIAAASFAALGLQRFHSSNN